MDDIDDKLFAELKYYCVKCLNDLNIESIKELNEYINKLDDSYVNELKVYILFPLRLVVSKLSKEKTCNEGIIIASCQCLAEVFRKSCAIERFDIVADVYSNLFHIIDPLWDENQNSHRSEELLLSVINCLNLLIAKCETKIVHNFISKEFRPQLGHSIKVLLHIASNQKYYLLKIESIRIIGLLIDKCDELNKNDDNADDHNAHYHNSQGVFAWFLPGISANLYNIIKSDDKLKKDVIKQIIIVLTKLFCFVFSDLNIKNDKLHSEEDEKNQKGIEKDQFIVNRDLNWLKMTCEKLNFIFKNMNSILLSHHNPAVTMQGFIFVKTLITKCDSKFIELCLSTLIQVPLTLLNHQDEQVSNECDLFFDEFSKIFLNDYYNDIIHDEIYNHLNSLPRLMRTLPDKEKIPAINLLYGYLKCLGQTGINSLLYSSSHKHKLFQSLYDIVEFDYYGVNLLDKTSFNYSNDSTDLNIEYIADKSIISKRFKNFSDLKVQNALSKCCYMISKCDYFLIMDYLIDTLRSSNLNPSVIFISNLIISNINLSSSDLNTIIEEYLNFLSKTSFVQADVDEERIQEKYHRTIIEINKEIIQTCLIIEGLVDCINSLDKKLVNKFLIKCLCPLLQCAGSSYLPIIQVAHDQLSKLAKFLNYISINDLISSNIDYLINTICIKLKHFLDNYGILLVFHVIMKYCEKEMMSYFIDPIDQILDLIDCYHHSQVVPLLNVIKIFIINLKRWDHIETIETNKSIEFPSLEQKSKNVVKNFSEFIKDKKMIKDGINEDVDMQEAEESDNVLNTEEDEEEESKPTLPKHIKLLENILERCVHLMSSYESKARLIVLEIVSLSLPIIKNYQDQLLPMAHKLWSPLVERFYDKDIIVIKNAFPCLIIMSETCQDFIRARTTKQVIPKILEFLKSQARISYKKDKISGYKYTLAYNIQLDILENIGHLVVNIDLQDNDLWKVISAIVPYLSSYQPLPFQDAAINALIIISQFDKSSVWFFIKMIYNEDKMVHESNNESFQRITLFQNNSNNNMEFKKNTHKLLERIKLID